MTPEKGVGLSLGARRSAPSFFIANRDGAMMFCSSDLVGSALLDASRHVLEDVFTRSPLAVPAIAQIDAQRIIRIFPLRGERPGWFAVLVESVNARDSLGAAVRRFEMTKRETAVLKLVIAGLSTSQIAEQLFITAGTVGDHIKSLFRKTNTNNRSGLVARVFEHHNDGNLTVRTVGSKKVLPFRSRDRAHRELR